MTPQGTCKRGVKLLCWMDEIRMDEMYTPLLLLVYDTAYPPTCLLLTGPGPPPGGKLATCPAVRVAGPTHCPEMGPACGHLRCRGPGVGVAAVPALAGCCLPSFLPCRPIARISSCTLAPDASFDGHRRRLRRGRNPHVSQDQGRLSSCDPQLR